MKNKFSFSSKNDGSEGLFKSLNSIEMSSIRGGKVIPIPPLPPSGGEDIPLTVRQVVPVLIIDIKSTLPVASPTAAVTII